MSSAADEDICTKPNQYATLSYGEPQLRNTQNPKRADKDESLFLEYKELMSPTKIYSLFIRCCGAYQRHILQQTLLHHVHQLAVNLSKLRRSTIMPMRYAIIILFGLYFGLVCYL